MQTLRHRYSYVAVLTVLAASCWGCGGGVADRPKVARVSGTVTYQGKAVEDAVLTFSAAGAPRKATGKTDAEGKFTLTTFLTDDGAVAGDHVITITKLKGPPPPAMNVETGGAEYTKAMESAAKPAVAADTGLPAKYADPEKSGLMRTVTLQGPNEFKIDLE